MSGLESDTIGGFNAMLLEQQKAEGEAYISTVLFDHESVVLHDRQNIKSVRPLTTQDYQVRGSTALMDAVGQAISHIGTVHKYAREEDRPERTLFVITTDGMENASRIYSADAVKQKIEHQKAKYGWEFLFLGANIDSAAAAQQIGIDESRAVTYRSDSKGTRLNYQVVSEAAAHFRGKAALPPNWKERIEKDVRSRK